jgi:hypothetical protein
MERITTASKDGGTSGAKALFSLAWGSNSETNSTEYYGFRLEYQITGYR